MKNDEWISAEEAQLRLAVRPQTLYAYASRGLMRVRPHPTDSRRSLYCAADVDDLSARQGRSRKLSDVASAAIAWGEPVLSSAITTVRGGRLYYRGQEAARLSADQPLEAIARLLLGKGPAVPPGGKRPSPPRDPDLGHRLYLALAARAAETPPMLGSRASVIEAEAAELLEVVADAVTGMRSVGAIHQRLARTWGLEPAGPQADLIRCMLVLVADHELNASTFAARVTASTGASLAAAILSGLSALSGPRHGGMSSMVRRFVAEAQVHGARDTVHHRLIDGRHLPGFGHALYPKGDIRAATLLEKFEMPEPLVAIRAAARDMADIEPNIDFAMLAACEACGLPEDAPFAIFATARCAGWIAHAVEQNESGSLIRPRARYVGAEPIEE
jgi:citrate synthase